MLDNRRSRGWVLGLVLVLASVLVGCGGTEGSGSAGASPDLDGSEWSLVKLQGANLLPGTNITVSFAEGNAGGFAGCNSYGGPYEAAGDGALSVSMLSATLMACLEPEGVMEQESAYLAALQEAAAYRVTGGRLEIEDGGGKVLLVFVPLP